MEKEKRTLSKNLTSVADFVHDGKFQFVAYLFNVFCSPVLQTMFGSSDLIFIAWDVCIYLILRSFYLSSQIALWKGRLNNDGHQCYKINKKEQSPLILNELTEQKKDNDIYH